MIFTRHKCNYPIRGYHPFRYLKLQYKTAHFQNVPLSCTRKIFGQGLALFCMVYNSSRVRKPYEITSSMINKLGFEEMANWIWSNRNSYFQ